MFRIITIAVFTRFVAMYLAGEVFAVFQEGGHPQTGLVAALFVLAFGAMIALANAAQSIVERMDRQQEQSN